MGLIVAAIGVAIIGSAVVLAVHLCTREQS